MIHNRLRHLVVQRTRLAGDAECAMRHTTPRAPRDLGQFVGGKRAHPPPVKLGQRGKGHMVNVEVQPHSDGIGCHQIVDLAILVQGHLRIACARAERPHHNRRAAFLAAQKLGNRIYIINRKSDNRAPGRHPAYLFRT